MSALRSISCTTTADFEKFAIAWSQSPDVNATVPASAPARNGEPVVLGSSNDVSAALSRPLWNSSSALCVRLGYDAHAPSRHAESATSHPPCAALLASTSRARDRAES